MISFWFPCAQVYQDDINLRFPLPRPTLHIEALPAERVARRGHKGRPTARKPRLDPRPHAWSACATPPNRESNLRMRTCKVSLRWWRNSSRLHSWPIPDSLLQLRCCPNLWNSVSGIKRAFNDCPGPARVTSALFIFTCNFLGIIILELGRDFASFLTD